jgi:hypothetical protein
MEISFYPKRPKGATETTLFARISYEGYKIKYYIPEKINPKFWSKETNRAKQTEKFKEYPEFNTRLNDIVTDCKNVYRKFKNDNEGITPNPETLKVLLDKVIKKREPEKEKLKTFFGFFDEITAPS